MSLLFHPARPSLLVGGSFNGEIFLWDISKKDDSLISSSTMDEYFHRESITQMIWVEQQNSLPINTLNSQYNLISLSTDGKMLFWNMKYEEKGDGSLLNYPIKGYSLLRKKEGFISNVGGLCFSHSCEDKDTFIIGTEAGSILRAVVANISFEKKQKVLFEQKSFLRSKCSLKNTPKTMAYKKFSQNTFSHPNLISEKSIPILLLPPSNHIWDLFIASIFHLSIGMSSYLLHWMAQFVYMIYCR